MENFRTLNTSIVIATYNSAKRLPELISNLRRQEPLGYSSSFEIIVVDGGSSDNTKDLALSLGCRVIDNPSGHAIAAKLLGFRLSTSRFVCFLDHDEHPQSLSSMFDKAKSINDNEFVRASISSGYLLEEESPTSNWYASEFGDPYSLFKYRFPNSFPFRVIALPKRMKVAWRTDDVVGLVSGTEKRPILLELVAANSMVDKTYFVKNFPDTTVDENLVPHFYSLMANQDSQINQIAILKNDPLKHQSVDSWKTVISKIRWRVSNSADKESTLYTAGVSGRTIFENKKFGFFSRLKVSNLAFVLYALFIVPVTVDGFYYAIKRKRIGYLMHIPLTYYVIYRGVVTKLGNLIGYTKKIERYDGSN